MKEGIRYFEAGSIWHICNKSISNFGILNSFLLGNRFIQTVDYYNNKNCKEKFGRILKAQSYIFAGPLVYSTNRIIKLLCYCIMPDHYHLLLKTMQENSVSQYISNIQNSYTRFFNLKFHRKGPLWQSRFRCSQIESDEQLLHVMRYIHLNPVTKALVDKPEEWKLSSYPQYLESDILQKMKEVSIQNVEKLKTFTENQIDYQRKLHGIKRSLLE